MVRAKPNWSDRLCHPCTYIHDLNTEIKEYILFMEIVYACKRSVFFSLREGEFCNCVEARTFPGKIHKKKLLFVKW